MLIAIFLNITNTQPQSARYGVIVWLQHDQQAACILHIINMIGTERDENALEQPKSAWHMGNVEICKIFLDGSQIWLRRHSATVACLRAWTINKVVLVTSLATLQAWYRLCCVDVLKSVSTFSNRPLYTAKWNGNFVTFDVLSGQCLNIILYTSSNVIYELVELR